MSKEFKDILNVNNNDNVKRSNPIGMVLLIPIIILILVFMIIPHIITVFRSFTDYTFINEPNIVMFKNYQLIFSNAYIVKCLGNTIFTMLFSVPLTVAISFLFAWISSKISKIYSYIISIMLLLVSVTSIAPIGITSILSSTHVNSSVLLQSPLFNRLLLILVPALIGIGPLYLMFTISFIRNDNIMKYLHLSVSLQLVICALSFFSLSLITGFPSVNYLAINLTGGIYDYTLIRFELGYGSALMILLAIILLLFTILYNGLVWLFGRTVKPVGADHTEYTTESTGTKFNPALSFFFFVAMFLLCVLLLSPFLQTLSDSFQSISFQSVMLRPYFSNSIITLVLSTASLFSLSLLGSIGYHMLSSGIKRILYLFVILSFVLSPTLLMFISQNVFNSGNLLLIVIPAIFKSCSFGLCILLCLTLTDSTSLGYYPGKGLSSPVAFVNSVLSIGSVSLIASLASWFNPLILSHRQDTRSIYELFYNMYSAGSPRAEQAHLLVLSMLIPIMIIIIFTPTLLFCLSRKVTKE